MGLVYRAVALIPMTQELLDDFPIVDWTVEDVDREVMACRYCKMVATRYGRDRCREHDRRRWLAMLNGPHSMEWS
jgi:hypothetical protein